MYLVLEKGAISFLADVEDVSFGDYWETLSTLTTAEPTSEDIAICAETGNIYPKYRGQVIEAVSVIREKVVSEINGEFQYEYETDMGVLIYLEGGVISVVRTDHHIPVLKVSYHNLSDYLKIPATSSLFEEDLHQRYSWDRSIIPISS